MSKEFEENLISSSFKATLSPLKGVASRSTKVVRGEIAKKVVTSLPGLPIEVRKFIARLIDPGSPSQS